MTDEHDLYGVSDDEVLEMQAIQEIYPEVPSAEWVENRVSELIRAAGSRARAVDLAHAYMGTEPTVH